MSDDESDLFETLDGAGDTPVSRSEPEERQCRDEIPWADEHTNPRDPMDRVLAITEHCRDEEESTTDARRSGEGHGARE